MFHIREKNYKVRSLAHGFSIIDLLLKSEETGLGVTELSRQSGILKSNVHRLVCTLTSLGYLHKNISTKKYGVSYKVLSLSHLFLEKIKLRKQAFLYLLELSREGTGEVFLGVLSGDKTIIIDRHRNIPYEMMEVNIGSTIPAHVSSISKVILAFSDKIIQRKFFNECSFEKITKKTITSPVKFRECLKKTKNLGYAENDEELKEGSGSIAAPIFDYRGKIIAGIALGCGRLSNIGEEKVSYLSKQVMDTARKISFSIGYMAGHLV